MNDETYIIAGQDEETLRAAVAVVEMLANADIDKIEELVESPISLASTLKAIATTLELFRVAVIR